MAAAISPSALGAENDGPDAQHAIDVRALTQNDGEPSRSLPEIPVDLYGDPLPRGAVSRLGTMRLRLDGWHKEVAFTAGGRTLVTASGERPYVQLWDAPTGRLVGEMVTAPFSPRKMRMLPDGKTLVTYGSHYVRELERFVHVIQLWDVPSRRLQSVIPVNVDADQHETIMVLETTPDGESVVLGTSIGKIRVLDLQSRQEIVTHQLGEDTIDALAISPDCEMLAATTRDGLYLWKWMADEKPERPEQGRPGRVASSLAFSPDGKSLAAAHGARGRLQIWDLDARRARLTIEEGTRSSLLIRRMAFIKDGAALLAATASAAPGHKPGVVMWNTSTGQPIRRFPLGTHGAESLAVSPDGRWLAAIGRSACHVWELETGEERSAHLVGHLELIGSVAFAEDDKTVVTCGLDGTVRIWDVRSGKQRRVYKHPGWVGAVAVSPDGKWIASSAEDLRVWDAKAGEVEYRLAGHGRGLRRALEFTPDGRQLVSWGDDNVLRAWDIQTGTAVNDHNVSPRPRPPGFGRSYARPANFALSSDAQRFALAGGDEVFVFSTKSGNPLRRLPINGLAHHGGEIQLSPDGRKLVISVAEKQESRDQWIVQVIDVASGNVEWQKKLPRGACGPAGFSPDGTLVAATVCGDRGAILVWDIATGTEQLRVEHVAHLAPGGRGQKLAISSDNRLLAVAMANATTLVWDLKTADP